METVPTHVAETKQFRKDLDEILQRMKEATNPKLAECRTSRERSLAITKIEEGIMWLGMDLKAQNTPNPYPHSKDPSSAVIDPTANGLTL